MRKALTLIAALGIAACQPTGEPMGTGPPVFEPEGPSLPAPEGPPSSPASSQPDFLLVVSEAGDSLFVASGAHVGVGQTVDVPARLVIGGTQAYNVVVGMEEAICELERLDLLGIVDDGTAAASHGLTGADGTGWMASACKVLGWRVQGPRTYELAIRARGTAAGKAEFRTQFDLVGEFDQAFSLFSVVEVVP